MRDKQKKMLVLGNVQLGEVEVDLREDVLVIPDRFPHPDVPGDFKLHYEIVTPPGKITVFQALQKLEDLEKIIRDYEFLLSILRNKADISDYVRRAVISLLEDAENQKKDLEQRMRDVVI